MYCQLYLEVFIFSSHMDFIANKCLYRKFIYGNFPYRVLLDYKTTASCHFTQTFLVYDFFFPNS